MLGITLGKETLKALSSDIRIDILRTLESRKMTVSELSRSMNMNKTTIYTHLIILKEAELIKRRERHGHKWVYYRLSFSGMSILHPEQTNFLVSLTFIVLSLLTMLYFIAPLAQFNVLVQDSPPIQPKNTTSPDMIVIFIILSIIMSIICLILLLIRQRKIKKLQKHIQK